MIESARDCPAVVLDTNVVLDWLVFADPRCSALSVALETRQVRWCATAPMLTEFRWAAARLPPERWADGVQRALTLFESIAILTPPPMPGRAARLVCRDPTDQMFIDLALHLPAACLVTRDRALLALARRAAPLGVRVLQPASWASA